MEGGTAPPIGRKGSIYQTGASWSPSILTAPELARCGELGCLRTGQSREHRLRTGGCEKAQSPMGSRE